jgi:hypothetical protein
VVGEGVTGSPIIGTLQCNADTAKPRIGVVPDAGPAYVLDPDGKSCLGQDAGKDVPTGSDFSASGTRYDTPAVPAFGHPAFAKLDPASGMSLIAPATGLLRASDILLQDYQNGQDFLGAWSLNGDGQFNPGFPAPVNDLQFLTGPSIADVDGVPGEEIIEGSASLDLQGFNAAGGSFDPQHWPRLTSDWTVANPLIGTWGTLDTAADARRVIFAITRAGGMQAYKTEGQPCNAASWPRFHHDNQNTGTVATDATEPGKPMNASLDGATLNFTAPGDDLLCGTAKSYQVVASNQAIASTSFRDGHTRAVPPTPQKAGTKQSVTVGSGYDHVAIRAVDDAGNVGPYAVVNRGGSGGSAGGGGGGTAGGGRAVRGCLSRRLRVTSRRLGRIRLGNRKSRVLKRVGAPRSRRRRVWRYCVRGGGKVVVVFSKKGRVRLVATTARGHGHGRARPGLKRSRLRRLHVRRLGRGLYLGTRRSRRNVFRVRRGRVRALALVDRGLARHRSTLRRYLRLAHL